MHGPTCQDSQIGQPVHKLHVEEMKCVYCLKHWFGKDGDIRVEALIVI